MSLCKRMFMVLSLVVAGLSLVACGEESAQVDHSFEIPADATERLNRGERVTVLPQTLAVNVGDTMTIVNNDSEAQSFGPYFVGAGETVTQIFKSATTLEGDCAFTVDGTYKIVISEPD